MEPFNREGTVFNADQEPDNIVRIDLHASELPSKKELEALRFRAAVEEAFRSVQHTRVDTNHEVLAPIDPLELARVNSKLVTRMRQDYLDGSLFGEVHNAAWLDTPSIQENQRRATIASFEDTRMRRSHVRLEDAA